MAENIPSYKYCFTEAEKAIKYTNDASKWTPNNLRRLFISPDCVIAQFHVGVAPRKRQFLPNKYMECISDAKYLKMTNALGGRAGTNICSHVEEVVYCLEGTNGGVLRQDESDWRAIISTGKASNSPDALKKAIGERFKRLRAFVIFNGAIQELMQIVGSKLSNPLYQISDDRIVSSNGKFSIVDIHKNDWYKGTYFRPSIYPSDAEGGSLYNRIMSVQSKFLAREEDNKKAANKDSVMNGYEIKFSDAYKRFSEVFSSYKKLAIKMLRKDKKTFLSAVYFEDFDLQQYKVTSTEVISDYFEIISDSLIEDLGRLGIKVSRDKKAISSEDVKKSIEFLNTLSIFYYEAMVSNYLRFFVNLKEKAGLDMYVEHFFEPAILIPNGTYLSSINTSVLETSINGYGSGKSISKSVEAMSKVLLEIGVLN